LKVRDDTEKSPNRRNKRNSHSTEKAGKRKWEKPDGGQEGVRGLYSVDTNHERAKEKTQRRSAATDRRHPGQHTRLGGGFSWEGLLAFAEKDKKEGGKGGG